MERFGQPFGFLLTLAWACTAQTQAPLPRDVPANHWAATAVRTVLDTGVMSAPNGVFAGERRITRAELVAVLARFARLLEARKWPSESPKALPEKQSKTTWKTRQVTRYEVAAVIARLGAFAMAGLPSQPSKTPYDSEAIPPVPRYDRSKVLPAARSDLQYLTSRRLLWPRSPLLEAGRQPVTGQQLADAVAQVISGVVSRMTDEPEEREDIVRPPR